MEDAFGVGMVEPRRERHEGGQRLRQRHGPAGHPCPQRLAHRQLHHQVQQAALGVLVEPHHADHGRVAQRRQRLRLAHEPRAGVGLRGGLHDLERGHQPAGQRGMDAVDGAHAPLAERGFDDPLPDALACPQHTSMIGTNVRYWRSFRARSGAARTAASRQTPRFPIDRSPALRKAPTPCHSNRFVFIPTSSAPCATSGS